MTKPFRLTGLHVLAITVLFFFVIIAVNVVFATLAVKSFPGEEEKKSYFQGLHFNDHLKALAAQEALGWAVEIDKAERSGNSAVIELVFKDSDQKPIYDLNVTGALWRPADDDYDQTLAFSPAGPGRYVTRADNVGPGVWQLKAEAVSVRNEKFALETKLYLK